MSINVKAFIMNLRHLNLDLYKIPEDENVQITVALIAAELQSRKLVNGLTSIGCDGCFCVPELCDLVLAFIGFDNRPDELCIYYYELLDKYCDKVTHENQPPIKEAFKIYNQLMQDRAARRFT